MASTVKKMGVYEIETDKSNGVRYVSNKSGDVVATFTSEESYNAWSQEHASDSLHESMMVTA